NTEPKHHYGVRLRVDFPLEENYLMTVEPGCYFVEALINHADVRARYAPQINWTEVERFRGIGGVRIEDDLLVTASGTRNLTDVVSKL
ncbi:MAG: M24 family metallopeptidase, partial [Proteobacteria bacterium]